ncbi:RLP19, partial [Symbiodinium sp. CCMP2592]
IYGDDELVRLKRKSTIRPSLPDEFADTGYSELMRYMLSSWSQFMSDRPGQDGKVRKKVTWKKRLQQLAAVVDHGRQKEAIMSQYGGHELYAAVTGTYWLRKVAFASLLLPRSEEELMATILGIVGPTRLYPAIRRCQLNQACTCQFVACSPTSRAHGQLAALELRSKRFDWPESEALSTVAATGVEYLGLEGVGAFRNPSFWLRVFPAIKVLQCSLGRSLRSIGNVTTLLKGWQDTLLGITLTWDDWPGVGEAPDELLESICLLKKLRRLELGGHISRLPACLGQLPLIELEVRGLQFRDDSALPPALSSLGETLVNFVGFSQGVDRSCNRLAPWNRTSPSFLTKCRARPSWDKGAPIDSSEEDAWAWQCPWEAWVARLDHPRAPWWFWHKIERFWVDANFLHGSFPDALAEAWPRLRSLDLQLNELSGPLPGAALSKLQNLTALRVQRNNFSGRVPAVLFDAPSLRYTNFEGNTELSGCIPWTKEKRGSSILQLPIQGTKITGLCRRSTTEGMEL